MADPAPRTAAEHVRADAPRAGGPRAVRRTRRVVVAVLVLGLVAAGFAAFAAVPLGRRFYLLEAPVLYAVAAPACWFAATVLYSVAARRVWGHRVWVIVVVAVAGALLCAAGAVLASLVALVHSGPPEETVAAEVAPGGRHVLVAESYVSVIDPSCRVYLRERGGPFSRQVVVWDRQEAPCPERMEFAGGNRIRIVEEAVPGRDTAPPLTTTFDRRRMSVAEELGGW
ncbi:hypothetical protein CLV63_12236 [Murinocardiopsis flavida]|uniref:Uncharacterized protein n=1 Tax=Murinocardiopsis flavida TaxID=645275 RepID=A0A2P8CZX3_9ACTN|nr:hypothetical protein [Murinocardiopsis flavida]PSK90502.1 hypothetical protein CLV63_12236 [Murinocardiopsis flavida]